MALVRIESVRFQLMLQYPDFILNLTYNLGFGENFEVWEKNQRDISPESKVRIFALRNNALSMCFPFLKIRQMLRMWRSYAGVGATTTAMVEALRRMRGAQDIIDLLNKDM